jgi:DNA-directed RNA polymerase subunit E'/Rpb7
VITYSSGIVQATNIVFEVVFECQICCPVEGMVFKCVAKNITKAGIRAESAEETPSPVIVFITRDHHFTMQYFSTIKENDIFNVRVLGQRFELNDKFISIIAELLEPKENTYHKPKLVLADK